MTRRGTLQLTLLAVLCLAASSTELGSSVDDIVREAKHALGRVSVTATAEGKQKEAIALVDDTIGILKKLRGILEAPAKQAEKARQAVPKLKELEIKITGAVKTCEKAAETGDWVRVHYVAKTLDDGQIFSSSFMTGSIPYKFRLGTEDAFVPAWNTGLENACEGERRRLLVPAAQAFGEKGWNARGVTVPGNSDLQFDLEVTSISKMRKRSSDL